MRNHSSVRGKMHNYEKTPRCLVKKFIFMRKHLGVWPFFKENIKNTRVFGCFFSKNSLNALVLESFFLETHLNTRLFEQ